MVDWQLNVRKQKVPAGGCPFYSPASTNTNIRVFFATCKSQYDWHLTLEDVSGFPGSLAGVLKELYAKRAKEWVSSFFDYVAELSKSSYLSFDFPVNSLALEKRPPAGESSPRKLNS